MNGARCPARQPDSLQRGFDGYPTGGRAEGTRGAKNDPDERGVRQVRFAALLHPDALALLPALLATAEAPNQVTHTTNENHKGNIMCNAAGASLVTVAQSLADLYGAPVTVDNLDATRAWADTRLPLASIRWTLYCVRQLRTAATLDQSAVELLIASAEAEEKRLEKAERRAYRRAFGPEAT